MMANKHLFELNSAFNGIKNNDTNLLLGVTFRESKGLPLHRWYSYVEGFSAPWIKGELEQFRGSKIKIYDPFGGCGTTLIEASKLGFESFYSEINPFMAFVIDTKLNTAIAAKNNFANISKQILCFIEAILSADYLEGAKSLVVPVEYSIFLERNYFKEEHLKQLVYALNLVEQLKCSIYIKQLLLLAIASIAVNSSNMTRRADLRRRRPDEYKEREVNISKSLAEKLYIMLNDIQTITGDLFPSTLISNDARFENKKYEDTFDLTITSPPYLNGTNYIRNTQIELLLLSFVKNEIDLKKLRSNMVCSGISDATKKRQHNLTQLYFIEDVASRLDIEAYDSRIPLMVRGYFSDMALVFRNVYLTLKPGANFVLDIGDSKFAGIHIPVDKFLIKIAELNSLHLVKSEIIARRYSRDKSELFQYKLTFKKMHREI